MDYNITLPPFAPNAVRHTHKGASAYTDLELTHNWLLDALNKSKYPDYMKVDDQGVITCPFLEREPALPILLKRAINRARDYYNMLVTEEEQLAMSDYIANIDSIQL